MTQETRKYPTTIVGLYTTTGTNSRSMVINQEYADKMCAAIQSAVGGKLGVKAVHPNTKKEKGKNFPDYFLEAITPDLLAEERERMAALNPNPRTAAPQAQSFADGDGGL
jgi:hypothetical protein